MRIQLAVGTATICASDVAICRPLCTTLPIARERPGLDRGSAHQVDVQLAGGVADTGRQRGVHRATQRRIERVANQPPCTVPSGL